MSDMSPFSLALLHAESATRAWLDGPGRVARANADRSAQDDYTADAAAADLGRYLASTLRAWGIAALRMSDALALLAMPPSDTEVHCVTLPPELVARGPLHVALGPNSFTPSPDASPEEGVSTFVATLVGPPAGTAPDPSRVWVLVTPAIDPMGVGGTLCLSIGCGGEPPTPITLTLDAETLELGVTPTVP